MNCYCDSCGGDLSGFFHLKCDVCLYGEANKEHENEFNDSVNNPTHYKRNGLEVITIIEAFDLGFRLGNSIKYILRAGKKNSKIEDLQKAEWYLRREIENLEKLQSESEE